METYRGKEAGTTRHLPLRVSEQTPSRIDTADGRSISISWSSHPADNPYAEAEAFAPVIARAVNAHDELVAACEEMVLHVNASQVPAEVIDAMRLALSRAKGEA